MEQLDGVVDNIIFQSNDNRFCVFTIKNKSNEKISCVYKGVAPLLGEQVLLNGGWQQHSKFGRQLNVLSFESIKPTSAEGIERFLASGAIKGIGRSMASRIVNCFGSDTLNILATAPHRLTDVSGIGKKKAEAIGMAYADISEMRELMLFLECHGVSSNYAPKLQAQYGSSAIMRIKNNPYTLADDIEGIGFRSEERRVGKEC